MTKFVDLTGMRFGRLCVIKFSRDVKYGNRIRKYWLCKCDCGNIHEVRRDSLTSGYVKSCGCLKKEQDAKNLTDKFQFKPKYDVVDKRLRGIWNKIKDRCFNENVESYNRYGGRGITICNEWLDFNVFAKWSLENGYSDNLTIDRIDNNGNYEPSNCRWITTKEQCNNRRNNIIVEYEGEKITLMKLSEITNISYGCLTSRYKRGYRGEELIKQVETPTTNNNKVTVSQVREIREKFSNGMTAKELSEIYPINYQSILNIVNFKTWKNI